MVFVETAVLLGWAGLGWAGLGWAGHEDQHFITITSLPPRSSCPAPARWPVSSSKSPEVNEFSVLLKHNDHMTLPCRYFHWHFCLLQPDYRLTKHQGRHCWTTLARVSSKVQSVGGRAGAAAAPCLTWSPPFILTSSALPAPTSVHLRRCSAINYEDNEINSVLLLPVNYFHSVELFGSAFCDKSSAPLIAVTVADAAPIKY